MNNFFECGSAAFDDNWQGSLRTVDLDGFLEYLFKTQTVLAIAVDGANRKWVGTSNGVSMNLSQKHRKLFNQ